MKLEHRTITTLYQVTEDVVGYSHDSPVIGACETFIKEDKTHGIYATKEKAEEIRDRVAFHRMKEGYKLSRETVLPENDLYFDATVLYSDNDDLHLCVEAFEVDSNEITTNEGNHYYRGEHIL